MDENLSPAQRVENIRAEYQMRPRSRDWEKTRAEAIAAIRECLPNLTDAGVADLLDGGNVVARFETI